MNLKFHFLHSVLGRERPYCMGRFQQQSGPPSARCHWLPARGWHWNECLVRMRWAGVLIGIQPLIYTKQSSHQVWELNFRISYLLRPVMGMRRERMRDPPRTHYPTPVMQGGLGRCQHVNVPVNFSRISEKQALSSFQYHLVLLYLLYNNNITSPEISPSRTFFLNQGRPKCRQKPTSEE